MAFKRNTILILGNGFDLAHDLPTKYSHFLMFCKNVEKIWHCFISEDDNAKAQTLAMFNGWETDKVIKDAVVTAFENRKITLNSEGKKEIISDNKELAEIHSVC